MNVVSIFLVTLLAVTSFLLLRLQPAKHSGSPEIVNAMGVFVIAVTLNITFPALLSVVLNNGDLVWAREYSNTGYVQTALLNVFLSLLAFALGYRAIALKQRRAEQPRSTKISAQPTVKTARPLALQALWIILAIGLALKLIALMQIGIGPDLIARLSSSVRRELAVVGAESDVTQNFIFFSTIADAAAAMLLASALKERRRLLVVVGATLLCLAATYFLSGKRSMLILPMVLVVCAFATFRRPITARSLPLVFVVILGFGMMTLLLRILAPQTAIGNFIDYGLLGDGSLVDFYLYSPEFASFDMLVRAMAQDQEVISLLGGRGIAFYRAFIEPFLYIIPRAVWPDKPMMFTDISHAFYALTFGGIINDQTPGLAATLVGYASVLGGPVAVIVAFVLLGWLASLVDRAEARSYAGLAIRAVGIVLVFQLFRQGSVGWVFLLFVQTMAPVIGVWLLFLWMNGPMTRRRVRTLA